MATPPETIICPKCGNTNTWSVEPCPKCKLPMGPVRALLSEQTDGDGSAEAEQPTASSKPEEARKPIEPAPPLPELPERGEHPPSATRVAADQFLVVGIGDRADEIRARVFKRLGEAGIEGLKLKQGQLVIDVGEGKSDARRYDFAERDLGDETLATMAVRMAVIGKDLFVNWRHYTLPPMETRGWQHQGEGWLIGLVGTALGIWIGVSIKPGESGFAASAMIALLAWTVGIAVMAISERLRAYGLKGFQSQESDAFQLAVRGAILKAIDDAGIDRALVQRQDDGSGPGNRVI